MATTSAFGWETPDDTDLVKDGAAAIRTLGNSIDTSMSELKGGTTGQVLSKTSGTDMDFTWTTVTAGTTEVNPNLIINGNFTINQRAYASAANLASGSYGFDRWKSGYTNTSLTYTAAPQGQSVTISASGVIQQIVERANVGAGTYTLSWTGTATGRIYNSGGTPPSYAASPVTFTADGLANVVVEFTAVSTTKTLSKVKLEIGSNATAFTFSGVTIQGELAACQRYFARLADGQYASTLDLVGTGQANSSSTGTVSLRFPVVMRTTPTMSVSSASGFYTSTSTGSSRATTAVAFGLKSPTSTWVDTTSSDLSAGNAYLLYTSGTNTLDASAEL